MEYKIYKTGDYSVSSWSGGTTTQLAIYPENSVYAERDFIWRLSSATVEAEESDFTELPDYNRILAVLKGEVILAYEGVRTVRLKELEYDYFDGAYKTKSYGKITDYNLMTRKGYEGKIDIVRLTDKSKILGFKAAMSRGVYAVGGYAVLTLDGNTVMLKDGEQLVIQDCPVMTVSVMGEGSLIFTEVHAPKEKEGTQTAGTTEPAAQNAAGGKGDFAFAMLLALTNFRGGRRISKKFKNMWFDEKLYRAVERLESKFVPFIVFMLGAVAVWYYFLLNEIPGKMVIPMAAWVIADVLLISPLLYYRAIPKPAAAHIKDINELTREEQEIQAKRLAENKRLDRIMKKYAKSGRKEFFGSEEE